MVQVTGSVLNAKIVLFPTLTNMPKFLLKSMK